MTKATNDVSVTLGNGAELPLLGMGTWQLEGEDAYRSVREALEVGYRHLDTATGYGNEREVGRALRESGVARDEVFVTTKCPPERAGRERETIEQSLELLGVDQVDLWLVHWPPGGKARPETWRELIWAAKAGKARAIGVSNYSTPQIDELVDATGVVPAVNQIRWSPFVYDPRRAAELQERGVVLEGYSPFRASNLADPVLQEIADTHGVRPSQVVVRWHLQHSVVVIPKSARRARLEENLAVYGFVLSDEEMARIDGLSKAAHPS